MTRRDVEMIAQTAALLSARAVRMDLNQGYHVAAEDARGLHSIATRLHRFSERNCNEDLGCRVCDGDGYARPHDGTVDRPAICRACAGKGHTLGRREARQEKLAQTTAAKYGLRVYFQGDPRGCPIYLIPEEDIPADGTELTEHVYDIETRENRQPTLEALQARWIDSRYNSRGVAVCNIG